MVAELEQDAPALVGRGRYALTAMPDGSWVITRAAPLCDRCETCGCGEQGEPITVPAFAVNMLNGGGLEALPAPMRAIFGRLIPGGR